MEDDEDDEEGTGNDPYKPTTCMQHQLIRNDVQDY